MNGYIYEYMYMYIHLKKMCVYQDTYIYQDMYMHVYVFIFNSASPMDLKAIHVLSAARFVKIISAL
jgi:hypothetical protein